MKTNIWEGKEHFLNDLVYNLHAMFFLCKRDISMEFENVGSIMRNYDLFKLSLLMHSPDFVGIIEWIIKIGQFAGYF